MKHEWRWVGSMLVLVMQTTACGSGSDAAPPSTVASPPPTTVAAAAPATIVVTSSVVPVPAHLSAAQRASLATAVADGRRLAHDEAWADAAARFEAALALAPGDAHVRCETGYAQLRAGNTSAAADHMRRVLAQLPTSVPASERQRAAMCLYNVGLVAEATNDPDAARDAYTRSIALRPNASVSEHLAALPSGDAWTPPPPPDWTVLPDGANEAAILAAVHDAACSDWHDFGGQPCPPVDQMSPTTTAPSSPPAGGFSAHVQGLGGRDYLVLTSSASTRFALVSGVGWDGGNVDITDMAYADLVPGGAPEVSFTVGEAMTGNGSEPCESSSSTWFVCTADGGVRCASITTGTSDECWVRDVGDGAEMTDDEREAATTSDARLAQLTVSGAQVTLVNGAGDAAFPADSVTASLVGTHSTSELLANPRIAFHGIDFGTMNGF